MVQLSRFNSLRKEKSSNSFSSIHDLCKQSLGSNTKFSLLWLEDGSNCFHNESLALSLLDICCSSSFL